MWDMTHRNLRFGQGTPPPLITGYNNTGLWPGVANRPTMPGAVLTWIGPTVAPLSAGGYHPSTASDNQQTRVLTSSAAISSTTTNQVIEGLDISVPSGYCIFVTSTGVTIRQCRFTITNQTTAYGVHICTGGNSVVIEDCLFRGPGEPQGGNTYNISCDGTLTANPVTGTIARCNLSGAIKAVGQYLASLTFIDNWCHDWSGSPQPDNDWIAAWFNSNLVTIQHNYFDQRTLSSGLSLGNPDANGAQQDSCINCTTYNSSTSITDVYAIGNAFVGNPNAAMRHFTFWDQYQSNANYPKNVKCQNNGYFGYTNSTNGDVAGGIGTGCTVLANSGNFIMATDQATSGSPLRGAGAL